MQHSFERCLSPERAASIVLARELYFVQCLDRRAITIEGRTNQRQRLPGSCNVCLNLGLRIAVGVVTLRRQVLQLLLKRSATIVIRRMRPRSDPTRLRNQQLKTESGW